MPRRILLLITDLEIGGTPTVVRELATRLHRPAEGVHVEVACLAKWGPVVDQIKAAGVDVTALGARRAIEFPAVVRRLRRLVRDRRFDTVFSFLLHANAVAAAASHALPGVRILQSIQTVQPWPAWHWWAQRRIHCRAEKVVVPSTAVERVARERCGVPLEKLLVIPNAVDVESLSAIARERNAFLARAHEAEMATRVGFLGRLDPVKRVDVLIRAMKRLIPPHLTHYRLHVFGDGPLRGRLEDLCHAELAPLMEYVFHGAVGSPAEALKQMDLLVLPSDSEGFGLVLIEAMAAGVPVVATDVPGIRDVVRHEQTGLLVPPASPVHLADAIRRIEEDKALTQRMIANAAAEVRQRYTWPAVIARYRQVLGL